jgi:hypothetical protein
MKGKKKEVRHVKLNINKQRERERARWNWWWRWLPLLSNGSSSFHSLFIALRTFLFCFGLNTIHCKSIDSFIQRDCFKSTATFLVFHRLTFFCSYFWFTNKSTISMLFQWKYMSKFQFEVKKQWKKSKAMFFFYKQVSNESRFIQLFLFLWLYFKDYCQSLSSLSFWILFQKRHRIVSRTFEIPSSLFVLDCQSMHCTTNDEDDKRKHEYTKVQKQTTEHQRRM